MRVIRWIGGGRYGVTRELGSGGFGRVWLAEDTLLHRTVAVKEVAIDRIPSADLPAFIERARREASSAAALSDHPHIVTVYDIVIEDGAPWIVMQYVKGLSLADVLRQHPGGLDESFVADIAEHMLLALGAAHAADLVHRDIKPQNIMVMTDERQRFARCLLADFGLAKSFASVSTGLTRSGELIGSWSYAAPERGSRTLGNLPPGDLFSLGVVLYEAVEGWSPFRRDDPHASMMAVVNEPLPPFLKADRLAPLITALTAKDPAERPRVDQALKMLENARRHRTERTPTAPGPPPGSHRLPDGPPIRQEKKPAASGRAPLTVGLIGAALMTLLLLIVGAVLWAAAVDHADAGDCVSRIDDEWSMDLSCSLPAPWGSNYRVLYKTTGEDLSPLDCASRVPDWNQATDVAVSNIQKSGKAIAVCLRPL
ncbi:serine/threonine-protein kinase [Streptomyces roseus]|uniref:serine/threonine-protein kinase n=1 Tax=Streptomyces roseus TaxID=66430 RepID=UPI0036AE4C1C